MKLVGVLVFALCVGVSLAAFSVGVKSKHMVEDLFAKINPRLEYDPTNHLGALSSKFAQCKNLHKTGLVRVEGDTSFYGESVGALIDSFPGKRSDWESVKKYLAAGLPQWLKRHEFAAQIKAATEFGCSVEPDCQDHVVIACLFTPEYPNRAIYPRPTVEHRYTPPVHPPTVGPLGALAFTQEHHTLVENMLRTKWDTSHFLENLSAYETSCAMVGKRDWPFSASKDVARERKVNALGLFGYAENRGDVTEGIQDILRSWTKTFTMKVDSVGCSVIPDCKVDRKMYVVISCLVDYRG